jgi:hypothetical protein
MDRIIEVKKVSSTPLRASLVRRFENEYWESTGVKASIYVIENKTSRDQADRPTLKQIKTIVEEEIPERSVEGMREYSPKLSGKSRERATVVYRHIYCLLGREYGYSLKEIGELINKDHTTVLSAIKVMKDRINVREESVMRALTKIRRKISDAYKGSVEGISEDDYQQGIEPQSSILASFSKGDEHLSIY